MRPSRIRKLILVTLLVLLLIKYVVRPMYRTWNSGWDFPSRNTCHRVKDVLFLKTHKTGGSTVANVLFRLAKNHDLTVALPRKQVYSFYWPWDFQPNFVDTLHGRNPNVLCSHARYNRTSMKSFMPTGTKFISILRQPISRFESAFIFEGFPAFLGITKVSNPLQHFVKELDKFTPEVSQMYTLRNGMSFDLGLEPEQFEETDAINHFISTVDMDFDLVLIMEYLDESLVLLKRQLCWDIQDVVYLKHNSRLKSYKKHHIPRNLQAKFLEWNRADVLLYKHFNETFWKIVNSQDDNFWSEVNLLKKKSMEMAKNCLIPGEHRDRTKRTVAKLVLNPKATQSDLALCKDLVQDEAGYFNYFREKQTS